MSHSSRLIGSLALSLTLGFATGCAASASDSAASASDLTAAKTITVSGAKAERLLNAFDLLQVIDHAMGGRESVDVSSLSVITSSNSALGNDDPSFMVPSTVAKLDDAEMSPSHIELRDPPAVAAIIFGALADVDDSLVASATGKSFATAAKISCKGQGPGAGNDPSNPPPTTATCKVTSEQGAVFTVIGANALRIVQGIGLSGDDAIDHAMGGRFSVEATSVSCVRRSNTALDETDPLFELPVYSCKATLPESGRFSIDDKDPVAVALQAALVNAGLQQDSAMGKTGVTSAQVSCRKGPGAPATCTLATE